MATKLQIDRRYEFRNSNLKITALDEQNATVIFESGQVGILGVALLKKDAIELPPREGEYYEGEEVEVYCDINWALAEYSCRINPCWHACAVPGETCLMIFTNDQIRRPFKPETKRRTPTDQDAIAEPRRKCWVRDHSGQAWTPAMLLEVYRNGGQVLFAARVCDCNVQCYPQCEIEVKNE